MMTKNLKENDTHILFFSTQEKKSFLFALFFSYIFMYSHGVVAVENNTNLLSLIP